MRVLSAGRAASLAALVLGGAALAASQLPFVWGVYAQTRGYGNDLGRVFVGAPTTYADEAATYWAWMRQAEDGRFFFTDLYTPEPHPRNYVNILFWLLGSVARVTGLDVRIVYSAARVLFGGLLLFLLWRLAGLLFDRAGPRFACFFFLTAASGWEGLGCWLERNAGGGHVSSPGWWTPEMSTFFSLMLFPHFLAGFAVMITALMLLHRGWEAADAGQRRPRPLFFGVAAGATMVVLTFFHPYDVVPVFAVAWAAPALYGLTRRRWPWASWGVTAAASVVWLPALVYNYIVFTGNPAMRWWDLQNVMVVPEPMRLVVAFGPGGVLAVSALLAWRKMSRGQAMMLAWFISAIVLVHLPLRFQWRCIGGIQFAIAASAVTAMVHVVDPAISRLVARVRSRSVGADPRGVRVLALAAVLVPLQVLTPYYLLDIEWGQVRRMEYPSWLEAQDYAALRELERVGPPESVVMASYETGNFVPTFAGMRAVLGHYALSANSKVKKTEIAAFYTDASSDAYRREIVQRYGIAYVVWTGHERKLGDFDPASADWLEEIFRAGTGEPAVVYRVRGAAESRRP